jgi:predicted GNAT family N-acyltransferase
VFGQGVQDTEDLGLLHQSLRMFREISFESKEYQQACQLRNEVLRKPLGLNLFLEDLKSEVDQMHFGWFDDAGNLLACVTAVRLSPIRVKIRQMACAEEHRGRGYGRELLKHLEATLLERGFEHISMHARVTALGFYEKLGYASVGGEFAEVGLPHARLEKHIYTPQG